MSGDIITPDILLRAYAMGIFPMADAKDDPEIYWVDPKRRGVFPFDGFHISKSLKRSILSADYHIEINTDFKGVVTGCAARPETWINDQIFDLYEALHKRGRAHCLEVWRDGALIGGVYGVALGGGFFGESMFSTQTDASKIALAYLVDRLRAGGFTLFDAQFLTPHLASLGAVEITRAAYHLQLEDALQYEGDFVSPPTPDAYSLIQRSTQTS